MPQLLSTALGLHLNAPAHTATNVAAASSSNVVTPKPQALAMKLSIMRRAVTMSALLLFACSQGTPRKGRVGRGPASVDQSSPRSESDMMVRIAEIDIHPNNLEEYKDILKEEAEASVRLEPGVVSIFPMYQKENPTSVRILEIYAGRDAYQSHIKSSHFLKYKTTTLKMVKSLRLVDMEAVDAAAMALMFRKMSAVAP